MISAYRDDRDRHLGADCHSHARAGTNSFYNVIAGADCCFVSAISYQEAGQVIYARAGINGVYDLEDFLALIKARIVPHDVHLAALALEAFGRYGKGIDSKARLNFCDCAVYALAISMNAPLLFKGRDFAETDVISCL